VIWTSGGRDFIAPSWAKHTRIIYAGAKRDPEFVLGRIESLCH
jgi:hypothetical protein